MLVSGWQSSMSEEEKRKKIIANFVWLTCPHFHILQFIDTFCNKSPCKLTYSCVTGYYYNGCFRQKKGRNIYEQLCSSVYGKKKYWHNSLIYERYSMRNFKVFETNVLSTFAWQGNSFGYWSRLVIHKYAGILPSCRRHEVHSFHFSLQFSNLP